MNNWRLCKIKVNFNKVIQKQYPWVCDKSKIRSSFRNTNKRNYHCWHFRAPTKTLRTEKNYRDKINTYIRVFCAEIKTNRHVSKSICNVFIGIAWKFVWNSTNSIESREFIFLRASHNRKKMTTFEPINKWNFRNIKSTATQTQTNNTVECLNCSARDRKMKKWLKKFEFCVVDFIPRTYGKLHRKRAARNDLRKLATTIPIHPIFALHIRSVFFLALKNEKIAQLIHHIY